MMMMEMEELVNNALDGRCTPAASLHAPTHLRDSRGQSSQVTPLSRFNTLCKTQLDQQGAADFTPGPHFELDVV